MKRKRIVSMLLVATMAATLLPDVAMIVAKRWH